MRLPTKPSAAETGRAEKNGLRRKVTRLDFSKPSWVPLLVGCLTILLCPLRGHTAEAGYVTFVLEFPGSEPEHYSITVSSDGHARYECSARIGPDSDEPTTYQAEFDFSPANRTRIFDLAGQAHYFAGKIDSGNPKLAFTGSKKLIYKDGHRSYTADYNYSSLPAVQQLTVLFQNVAATLEYGRRLSFYHRYQKLALDEELKRMEGQTKSGDLSELQAVESVLREIFDDTSVMNVVRARAQRLMELSKAEPRSR